MIRLGPLDGLTVVSMDPWPGAKLLTTHGLGHRRLLKEAATLGSIAEFAATGEARRRDA